MKRSTKASGANSKAAAAAFERAYPNVAKGKHTEAQRAKLAEALAILASISGGKKMKA